MSTILRKFHRPKALRPDLNGRRAAYTILPDVLVNWQRSLRYGTAFEMTFPLLGNDGQFRSFYALAELLKDLDGNVVQWFGTCTDVSKLQSIQEDLTTTQHWLQEGLVALRLAAWEWDLRSCEVRYSENDPAVLGYGPGRSPSPFKAVHEDDRDTFDMAIDRAIPVCGSIDQVTRRIRPDNGKLIWIRAKGHVLGVLHGKPRGMRGILIDVTEQVLREKALEDASKRKDEFLAMLAHELRNPLAPIATAAPILALGGADTQRVKTYAEIITRQLGHMTRLIDDLLDVSRVTRGLVELEHRPLLIRDIVNNAIEQTRSMIEARGHEKNVQLDTISAMVTGDRVRLCQILANLLNNSVKYTPQGGKISLGIEANGGEVSITIADNGIGIDEKLLPHVFDLFTQATRTPDRAQGGLCLGLALVDSLVRMHGGVSAHSAGLGTGARFVVTLPLLTDTAHLQNGAASTASKQLHDEIKGLTIMLVDDNVDATDMPADILRLQGHTVRSEYTSTGALAAAQHAVFDLYILDIGLPNLDGYELVRRLRSQSQQAGAVFIALTGYGQAHDKVLSKSAGFDHHLVKPGDVADLHAIIQSIGR